MSKNVHMKKDVNTPKSEIPESLLIENQHHQNVPIPWWGRVPGVRSIKDYLASTCLHGLKHFFEPSRLTERFYRLVAVVLVCVGLIISLYDQGKLYFNRPVLMALDSSTTPVWDIPFPAVTICSENQIRPSFFNYSDSKSRTKMTKNQLQETLEYLRIICDYNTTGSGLNFYSTDALDLIHNDIWGSCNETIGLVWSVQYMENVCSMIQPVLTPLGACHTVNSLPGNRLYRESIFSSLPNYDRQVKSSDEDIIWSPDRGYRGKNEFMSPPWRVRGGGYYQDVYLILNLNMPNFDDRCSYGSHGFEVILHSPAEVPTPSHPSIHVRADCLTTVRIVPEIRKTKEDLRKWNPKLRGCYFDDERPLQYFQYYTEKNCDLECGSNASLSLCGCVPFFHPRTKDIPVCGYEKFPCYIASILRSHDPDTDMYDDCDCLPACSEVEYRISVANFNRNLSSLQTKVVLPNIETKTKNNFALVKIQYQTKRVTAQIRVAVFTFTDFLANIGGLLGLFLGFDLLRSSEEIFAFVMNYLKK